jgi:nitrous oxidase accessory protein
MTSVRSAVACLFVAAVATGAATSAQERGVEHAATPGVLEGRPTGRAVSPLQGRLDAAAPGATIVVEAGAYDGDLLIDRPVHLLGRDRPLLRGFGDGSVVRVRANDVTVEGFDIDGRGGGDLGRDSSGVHVTGWRVVVRDCVIRNALFGVYLREANGARVEHNEIDGIPGKTPGEKGSGIHVWNTDGFTLVDNTVRDVRDGFYIQSSPHGLTARNTARDLRYGLHYMFSDDNVFEDNRFENGAAGAALMYSRRLTFRRNRFVHNRGFASVGLLLQACDDVRAEDNLIADNARGLFLEGSTRSVFVRNVIAESDVALVLYDSNRGLRFEGNSFIANLSPLQLVGRRTDTVVRGNYWSDQGQPDLDGDGFADRPYRLTNAFDHFRGNLTAADLFAQGVAARALGVAERTFPVLDLVQVVDDHPLAQAPVLDAVPSELSRAAGGRSTAGLGLSSAALAVGLWAGVAGYRGRRFHPRPRSKPSGRVGQSGGRP